jgi:aryl-alcohol dehydrogenase-like predicted oxidoreductase
MIARRRFIQLAATASASLSGVGGLLRAGEAVSEGGLSRRVLGKTNVPVTILGLGGAWIAQPKPPRGRGAASKDARGILETAYEGGIRYFDTAPSYLRSEELLGRVLSPVRKNIFLATKLDHGDAKTAEQDLAGSLKRLKTDYVDLLLLHGLGLDGFNDFEALAAKDGALTFLRQAKEKGLARFIGFSTHPRNLAAQRQFAQEAGVDVIQPWINYISRAEFNMEAAWLTYARAHHLGVTAMKVLGGDGQLADDYDLAFRYALSQPGVHCALVGAHNPEEVERAVQAAREFRPLTEAEMQNAIALGQKLHKAQSRKAALLRRHQHRDWHCAVA